MRVPFNYPYITGKEVEHIKDVLHSRQLCGDGKYSRLCQTWLEEALQCPRALLTPSGTAALEMAALLLDIQPGDEVIMPSFTFVSTANAFVLRGANVVFVDIREDTLNIDPLEVKKAITEKTRAVVPVHYAGVGCDMFEIAEICRNDGIAIVEDAAHAVMSKYRERPLGTFGSLAALSFHETKNLVAGEAGALIINDERMIARAEIIREKGTDRSRFFRGQIDKYRWQDLGSSYLPSELQAAFLWAQMERAEFILSARQSRWLEYHHKLAPLEEVGLVRRPIVPEPAMQNGHIYYLLAECRDTRDRLMEFLHEREIGCVFHYIPLHDAPGAEIRSRQVGDLSVTSDVSSRLLRLPLSVELTSEQIDFVVRSICEFFEFDENHLKDQNERFFSPVKSS
ncbi:MAG TPA: dTDP-4-amino-4,6-dideoxygalactose transaminase [Candidatus Melainabacteria bacterium]|nr:dTDP-4-amino-4,6-dideoxygalactose transaminase [Candidatus Melainabacteria bacterium]